MNINFNKIIEIYGEEYIKLINENIDVVIQNLNYLKLLGFQDIEDIFERYTNIFLEDDKDFQDKINKLIARLGRNYVDIIENDLNILEGLNN